MRGITINKSLGRKLSIDEIKHKFTAHVESMEGAAICYTCNWLGIECYQIRAISTYVEPCDSSKWNIPLALENLKQNMIEVLQKVPVPIT